MAIKISNNTIIDDNRVVVNTSKVGIGTTNPTSELTVDGNVLVNDWNIPSTISVGATFYINDSDLNTMVGFVMSNDLRYLYVADSSEDIFQYTLESPGNVSSASTTNFFKINLDDYGYSPYNSPKGIIFSPTGTDFYAVSSSTASIVQFPITEPWMMNSIGNVVGVVTLTSFLSSATPDIESLWFKPDGTKLYVGETDNSATFNTIHQFNLPTPWDITSIVGLETSYVSTANTITSRGHFVMSSDGKYFFEHGGTLPETFLDVYELKIPWEIDTSHFLKTITLSGISTTYSAETLYLSPDGAKIFLGSDESAAAVTVNTIYQFNLNESLSKTEIVGQADIYGTLNSHQNLNSYGTFESTGQTLVNSINNGPIAGFRNYVLNGGLDFWQRGTSFTITNTNRYNYVADMFRIKRDNATAGVAGTVTRQEFTPGQTNVPGEPRYYLRWNESNLGTSTNKTLDFLLEGGRLPFAGKTLTLSFCARSSDSGGLTISQLGYYQYAGNGGSGDTNQNILENSIILKSFWKRYSLTFKSKNLTGMTIVDSTAISLIYIVLPNNASFNIDIAQIQLEEGPIATPFSRIPSSYEERMVKRHYQKGSINEGGSIAIKVSANSTINFNSTHYFNPPMFKQPSITIDGTPTYDGGSDSLTVVGITTNSFTTVINRNNNGQAIRAYNWSWTANAQ